MLAFLASLISRSSALKEGGLYVTKQEDGSWAVAKVLKVDEIGLHVRLYSNRFNSLPKDLDPAALYMVGMNRKPAEQAGLGHLPIRKEGFAAWKPQLIKTVPVTDEELDGYKIWQEAKGGYF